MIKVLLVDDHHLFREGLARILNDEPDIDLVGSAADGEEAIALTRQVQPDVVLMDLNMPHMGGLDAARHILRRHPEVRVLVLTVSEKGSDLFDALRAGVRGYLLKDISSQMLVEAIRQVHAGAAPIAPSMASWLIDEFVALSSTLSTNGQAEILEPLTCREEDVLRLVARGMSNKEIGTALSISPLTVKSHLSSILEKLNLRGRVEAAAWAIRHGLLREE